VDLGQLTDDGGDDLLDGVSLVIHNAARVLIHCFFSPFLPSSPSSLFLQPLLSSTTPAKVKPNSFILLFSSLSPLLSSPLFLSPPPPPPPSFPPFYSSTQNKEQVSFAATYKELYQVITLATIVLINAAIRANASFHYISTSGVLGRGVGGEEDEPPPPPLPSGLQWV